MLLLTDLLYLFCGLAYLPFLLYQAVVLGKNRRGWRQRFGSIPRFDAAKPRVWIHGVSLGEINATPKLIQWLEQSLPDHEFVISSTTDTGFARARHHFGNDRVFRFPLDFSWIVRRALDRIQPAMIVLMEQELWFNLVRIATKRGIPVVVVNGRMTRRSAERYARLGILSRGVFGRLAWVGAQDDAIADRFRRLGADERRVDVVPSLKWDSAPVADAVPDTQDLAHDLGLDVARRVWVCGSTGPGEEAMLLDAYAQLEPVKDRPRLVLVPRKPERFDEVARLIGQRGFDGVRRSRYRAGAVPPTLTERSVILGDTMGELRKFYCLADVVFVGRSLVDMGGSDPMEVAALAKPIIVGPFTSNFQQPIAALQAEKAVEIVPNAQQLTMAIGRLLADPESARAMGARAREAVLNHQGGTQKTAEALVSILKQRSTESLP
ncbi:MAG: 3-deoxy-D-manno-octulosonic acid transferase [Phycisphaerae bacterium]